MEQPEIVGVHIPAYKNLRDVWLPWSDRIALVGRNGAGKTNLLEALAAVIGTDEVLSLTRSRIDESGALGVSVIVRNDPLALPSGPRVFGTMPDQTFSGVFTPLLWEMEWWRRIGVEEGDSFEEAVRSWSLDDRLKSQILTAAKVPVVQYTLAAFEHESRGVEWSCPECGEDAEPVGISDERCVECGSPLDKQWTGTSREGRLYHRTLLSADLEPVDAVNPSTALGPYGRPVAGTSGFKVLLDLPATARASAQLQWLPMSRADRQVTESLVDEFDAAALPTGDFLDRLGQVTPALTSLDRKDAHWWLHRIGEEAANYELTRTAPQLRIDSEGGEDAEWVLGVASPERRLVEVKVGHSLDQPLERFSAGQRRWMDEALATLSRSLHRHGERMKLFSQFIDQLDDETLLEALEGPIELAEADDYWTAEALDAVLRALEPKLQQLARAEYAGVNIAVRTFSRLLLPQIAQLEQQIVVRVIDEPEAHLHVSAQRRAALALDGLANEGQNVVIATHSPVFLDLPGWTIAHVRDGTLGLLPNQEPAMATELGRDLGVTRGDLLSGIERIVVVEGEHDRLILNRFFGSELRRCRVAVVRMFGTDHVQAAVDLDFISRYVDVPIAIMLDNFSALNVKHRSPQTPEERKVADMLKFAHRSGRPLPELIGLHCPDIVCYLAEEAVREINPGFSTWPEVIERFRQKRIAEDQEAACGKGTKRVRFKSWLGALSGGANLTSIGKIDEVIEVMRRENMPLTGDLHQQLSGYLARALDLQSDGLGLG